MANTITYKTIFKFRRGLASLWASANPILQDGEPGFELDTGKLKIGNGTTPWNDLNYINGNSISVDVDNQSIIIDGLGQISLKGFTEAQSGQSIRKNEQGSLEWYTPISQEELDSLIKAISIGGVDLPVEDNRVAIPIGTQDNLGVIKGSESDNQVSILSDGTAEINSVSTDKLINAEDSVLILDCGTATATN